MPALSQPADSTNWFQSWLGDWLLEQEAELCQHLVPDGYYPSALQVGMSHTDLLKRIETGFRFLVRTPSLQIANSVVAPGFKTAPGAKQQEPAPAFPLVAEATALPFGDRSHSLIMLPHQLDFCRNPHLVLREINQILIPEGCMVITGFNRLSLWGTGGVSRRRYHHGPWSGRYCRPGQIQDWLSLLGYDVVGARQLAYGPLIQSEKWHNRFGFMEKMGDRWWPAMGAAYVIVGKKREIARIPETRRLAWKQFIPAIARPAVQSGNNMSSTGMSNTGMLNNGMSNNGMSNNGNGRRHLHLVTGKDSKS